MNVLCRESADYFTGIWVGYLNTGAGARKVSLLFNPDVRAIHQKMARFRENHQQDVLLIARPGKVFSVRAVDTASVAGFWSVENGVVSSRKPLTSETWILSE